MVQFGAPKISIDKSWKFTPQVLILIIIGILVILGLFIFITREKKEIPLPEIPPAPPSAQLPAPEEILKPGTVGEVPETPETGEAPEVEKPKVSPEAPGLPPVISGTSGKILEIKEDRIIVAGSGSNFVDQKPRSLTVIFTSSTLVFEPGQKVKYQGLEGLKHLKTGTEIVIEGAENIRGKTEFIAGIINIL